MNAVLPTSNYAVVKLLKFGKGEEKEKTYRKYFAC